MSFDPTPEQQIIYDALAAGEVRAIAIEAEPGAAKTTTLVQAIKTILPKEKGYMTCFGRKIRDEIELKVEGTEFKAKTFNQIGWAAMLSYVKKHLGRPLTDEEVKKLNADETKYKVLAQKAIKGNYLESHGIEPVELPEYAHYPAMIFIHDLVRFTQMTMTDVYDRLKLREMITDYDFMPRVEPLGFADNTDLIIEEILNWGLDNLPQFMKLGKDLILSEICMTFTDQIYYAVQEKIYLYPRKYLFVDEAQDMSLLEMHLLGRLQHRDGYIVLVGDSNQSIMRFKGAMSGSFNKMVNFFKAKKYRLSATFRCSRRVVRLANLVSPDLQAFFNRDGSIELKVPPKVNTDVASLIVDTVKNSTSNDIAIIARTSAPLITMCLYLIGENIPATILGTDIGEELNHILDRLTKVKDYSFDTIINTLNYYRDTQILKLKESLADDRTIQDKRATFDALKLLIERNADAKTLDDLKQRISALFTQTDTDKAVKLMTAHKSKGLEFDTVIMYNDFPVTKVAGENRIISNPYDESYVWFVAVTRAKNHLIVLDSKKPDWLQGHLPGDAGYELPPFTPPTPAPIEEDEELVQEPEADEPKVLSEPETKPEERPARVLTRQGESARDWAKERLEKLDFVIFDTETTGFKGEIIQIGLCDAHGNALMNTLIKPAHYEIEQGAMDVHGITPDKVADAPHFADVMHTFVEAIRDKVVIAYNMPFDRERLQTTTNASGLPLLNHLPSQWNCAMKRYSDYNPDKMYYGRPGGWWKLAEAIEQENIKPEGDQFHDALFDVRSTLAVMQSMAGQPITAFDGSNTTLPITTREHETHKIGARVHARSSKTLIGTIHAFLPPNQFSVWWDSNEKPKSSDTFYDHQLILVDEVQPNYLYDEPIGPELPPKPVEQPQAIQSDEPMEASPATEAEEPAAPTFKAEQTVEIISTAEKGTIRTVGEKLITVKTTSGKYKPIAPDNLRLVTKQVEQPKPVDQPSPPKIIEMPKARVKTIMSAKTRKQVKDMLNKPDVELDHLLEIRQLLDDLIAERQKAQV